MAGAESTGGNHTACAFYQFYAEGGGADCVTVCGFASQDGTQCEGLVEQRLVPPTDEAEVAEQAPVIVDDAGQLLEPRTCLAMPDGEDITRRKQANFWASVAYTARSFDAEPAADRIVPAIPEQPEAYGIGRGCAGTQAGYYVFSSWLGNSEIDPNKQFTCVKLDLSSGQPICTAHTELQLSQHRSGKYISTEPLDENGQPDEQAPCIVEYRDNVDPRRVLGNILKVNQEPTGDQ